MKSDSLPKKLPNHVAFIMDGNGRWASKRLLPRKAGHREGVNVMRKIVRECVSIGIPCITVYAFSTENRDRPQEEVDALLSLMEEHISGFLDELLEMGVRVTVMGDLSYFSESMRSILENAMEKSASYTRSTLNLALNYGARDEIVRAVNLAIEKGSKISKEEFARLLYTSTVPDPDLIVRTGGEARLSNFMLWQCAYSEFAFTKTLWPDFNKKELYSILNDFATRERRFGKVKS